MLCHKLEAGLRSRCETSLVNRFTILLAYTWTFQSTCTYKMTHHIIHLWIEFRKPFQGLASGRGGKHSLALLLSIQEGGVSGETLWFLLVQTFLAETRKSFARRRRRRWGCLLKTQIGIQFPQFHGRLFFANLRFKWVYPSVHPIFPNFERFY